MVFALDVVSDTTNFMGFLLMAAVHPLNVHARANFLTDPVTNSRRYRGLPGLAASL